MSNAISLGDVIHTIVQNHGENALKNSQFTMSVFMDLAPAMRKERELLRSFYLCDGANKLLWAKRESRQEQERCMNVLVQNLEDSCGMSRSAAQSVCGEFYRGITGRNWTFAAPASGGTQQGGSSGSAVHKPVETAAPASGNTVNSVTMRRLAVLGVAIVLLIGILMLPKLFSSPQNQAPAVSGNSGQAVQRPAAAHTHSWKAATCTEPRTCTTCGEVSGTAAGHSWVDATYDAPKTCRTCGRTEGVKLGPDAVYINELKYSDKYGKIWTLSNSTPSYHVHTDVNDAEDYKDMNTPGHTTGPVYDYLGNKYTYGIHVDGDEFASYYISYNIGGKYKTFEGVVSMSADMDGDSRASSKSKYFEVYGDGVLLFRSQEFSQGSSPQKFKIDVSNVKILKIQYPKTSGPSRLATLYDGKLS